MFCMQKLLTYIMIVELPECHQTALFCSFLQVPQTYP